MSGELGVLWILHKKERVVVFIGDFPGANRKRASNIARQLEYSDLLEQCFNDFQGESTETLHHSGWQACCSGLKGYGCVGNENDG